ncbi:MAG: hypothetical protein M0P74_04740 [Syntrophales bacterium]|jgi:predicted DNA-binding transcriptional regulator YafY|nr:hypothetical protein [Syntrophales bacterium]
MVASSAFPNSVGLAAHFDISRKQAQRDIEFMRDRLSAPLLYNAGRRGYGYADGSYELPPVWLKEEEIQALSLALRLSAVFPVPARAFILTTRPRAAKIFCCSSVGFI